jgi:siroheme synthase
VTAPSGDVHELYPVGLRLLDRRHQGSSTAVISDGAGPAQRVLRTTLAGLPSAMADQGVRPPAVWVVGEVVGRVA